MSHCSCYCGSPKKSKVNRIDLLCCLTQGGLRRGYTEAACCISHSRVLPFAVRRGHSIWLVWVIVVVTIRQCAESLSIRVGADHFLVSHHPGSGVVYLGTEKQTVQLTDKSQHWLNTRLHIPSGILFVFVLPNMPSLCAATINCVPLDGVIGLVSVCVKVICTMWTWHKPIFSNECKFDWCT